ncbi:creatininase family protein [Pseudooceanicola sp. CBS1P-1]|uniref:Creatininase family protein n=1 Tax=Pseudooceanicola albus TaxID=2692189 RepID=A0A6L7G7N6_9RHOB|nr:MULTISPECIES: creatininase family protein [Pseudooceanicola]MBT9385233.1 creatininase family protein [Pseudooceanicola endophyticus]MXN18683.1 creatininase family protein [Pseudooceanicola albus]
MGDHFYWEEYTAQEFGRLAAEDAIAILPIAATEQHGPHLPVATDSAIARGMLERLARALPEGLRAVVLPVQQVGKSNEHIRSAGTLTLPPEVLIAAWTALGEGVHRAGLRKMVIVNSHGGNNQVMDIVARALREKLDMMVVTTQWNRFGVPEGSVEADELRWGVHAGLVETSLMMAFRPDLVRHDQLRDFPSASARLERDFKHLRLTGKHNMAWIIQDVNADGAVGNASGGSAELGERIVAHQVAGMVELLREIARYTPVPGPSAAVPRTGEPA